MRCGSTNNINRFGQNKSQNLISFKRLNNTRNTLREQRKSYDWLKATNSDLADFQLFADDRYIKIFNKKQTDEEFDPSKMKIDVKSEVILPYK